MKNNILVIQHVFSEGLGIIGDILARKNLKPIFVKVFENEKVPKTIDGYSALIVMGGPMGVYEEKTYPFIKDEIVLIKDSLKKNIPALGICLGAQLIAKTSGSSVYKGKKKEIGWYKIRLTEDGKKDVLFKELPDEFTVFQWHGDTFDVPNPGVKLAYSDLFENQAIKIGRNAYGIQFHLEVTWDMVKEWIDVNDEELKAVKDYIDAKWILKETPKFVNTANEYGRIIFNRFFDLID